MKKILTGLTLAMTAAAAFAGEVLFTEKEYVAGNGKVYLPETAAEVMSEDGRISLRVEMEYASDKRCTFEFASDNSAFSGLCNKFIPGTKGEVRKLSLDCTFYTQSYAKTFFRINKSKVFELKSLSVRTIDAEEYVPCTCKPEVHWFKNTRCVKMKNELAAMKPGYILLLGDSLTDNWGKNDRFNYMKENFNVYNAGNCSDRIEDLLWRVNDMGETIKANPPSLVTLLIGTNNLSAQHSNEDIAKGLENLIGTVRKYCPETKFIVFAIPPRAHSKLRPLPFPAFVNELYRRRMSELAIPFFNFSDLLLDPDTDLMIGGMYENDMLHFSDRGYAEVVTPFISGAIRLANAKNRPARYFEVMAAWEEYLRDRLETTTKNHALEEMLACRIHLADLNRYYLDVFKTLEKDPGAAVTYPAELLRQQKAEGLPEFIRELLK